MPTFGPTCKKIIRAALKAVDPENLVYDRVIRQGEDLTIRGQGHVSRTYHLKDYADIHVLGAGKGAPFLFQALEKILGQRLTGGLIISDIVDSPPADIGSGPTRTNVADIRLFYIGTPGST